MVLRQILVPGKCFDGCFTFFVTAIAAAKEVIK